MPAKPKHPETNDRPERKTERLELRVTPAAKETIQRAAAISGMTPGELAYEGARKVIDDHEHMVLTGADRDEFLAALLNPPPPNEALIAAFQKFRHLLD